MLLYVQTLNEASNQKKVHFFFSMNDNVLISIKQYCTDHGCPKTAKKITIESVSESPKLEDVFKDLDIEKKRKIKVAPFGEEDKENQGLS